MQETSPFLRLPRICLRRLLLCLCLNLDYISTSVSTSISTSPLPRPRPGPGPPPRLDGYQFPLFWGGLNTFCIGHTRVRLNCGHPWLLDFNVVLQRTSRLGFWTFRWDFFDFGFHLEEFFTGKLCYFLYFFPLFFGLYSNS